MLYLIHGSNREKCREKLFALMASIQEKKPDASIVRLEGGDLTPSLLEESVGGAGLFEHKLLVVLTDAFTDPLGTEAFIEALPSIRDTENVFLVETRTLPKDVGVLLTQSAQKVWEYSLPPAPKEVSIFELADGLIERDRKKVWTGILRERERGSAIEEIHGTLFWQVKSMYLAKSAKNAEDVGLKPFVFSKSLRGAKRYSSSELATLLHALVVMYHDSRRGRADLESEVERFALSL